MSYCRFSSDDFSCDVYVYESGSGWITSVAGNRIVGDIPKIPPWNSVSVAEIFAAERAQMDFLNTAQREDIDLPLAGDTFSDATPWECADRLESLRALGYRVPQKPRQDGVRAVPLAISFGRSLIRQRVGHEMQAASGYQWQSF